MCGIFVFLQLPLIVMLFNKFVRQHPNIVHMKKIILFTPLLFILFAACNHKTVKQGSVTYDIQYQLPDSLNNYKAYLPKTAVVYFRGDSTVSIQQAGAEAT